MKRIIILIILIWSSITTQAQVVNVKGSGTSSYPKDLTVAIREIAYQKAQINAIERYFAENGESETENFEANQEKIQSNLEKFILNTTTISELDQPGERKYQVAVRIELNVAKLRNTLRSSSAASKAPKGEKSKLVYVFVGREVSSVRTFDARVLKRVDISASIDEKEAVTASVNAQNSKGGTTTSISSSSKASVNVATDTSRTIETGGSTTRKADESAYRILSMSNVKTSITGAFSQGGFEVIDPEFILEDREIRAVNSDFSSGNDLSRTTLLNVVAALKRERIPYLIIATLDVGMPIDDSATGLKRVAVSVTGRVLDITGSLPSEAAAVPPIQYFGVGQDNSAASGKGLKDAASAAAREIISRMNAAGIR